MKEEEEKRIKMMEKMMNGGGSGVSQAEVDRFRSIYEDVEEEDDLNQLD